MKNRMKSRLCIILCIALACTSLFAVAPAAFAATNLIQNGSFEEGAPSVTGISLHTSYPGWQITGGRLEIHRLPFNLGGDTYFASAAAGNASAELNSDKGAAATIYQDFATTPGSVLSVRFAVSQRNYADTMMEVRMGAPGSESAVKSVGKVAVAKWTYVQFDYTVPAGQTTTRIKFASLNGHLTSVSNDLDDVSVTVTSSPEPECKATVTTGDAQNVTANTATIVNNTFTSTQSVRYAGIVLADNAAFANQDVYTGSVASPFSITNIANLRPVTTYYYRAFIQTTDGNYYFGAVKTFTTREGSVPSIVSVTTGDPQSVTDTTATIVNNSYAGTSSVNAVGIVLANNAGFANQQVYTTGVGTPFTINNIANLTPNTTYYYRAFIQTTDGNYYFGAVKTFTTVCGQLPTTVTVTTGDPQSVTANTAAVVNNSYTGSNVQVVGIVLANNAGFANQNVYTTGVGSPFAINNIANLLPSTTYYYRAFVQTTNGQYYFGAVKTFTTTPGSQGPTCTILIDQNFESGYSPFVKWGYPSISLVAKAGVNGSTATYFKGDNGGYEYKFTATPYTTYELSGYGRVGCAGQSLKIGMKDGSQEFYQTFTSTSYQQQTVKLTTGAKSVTVTAYIYVPNTGGKSYDTYIDNVVLKKCN